MSLKMISDHLIRHLFRLLGVGPQDSYHHHGPGWKMKGFSLYKMNFNDKELHFYDTPKYFKESCN